MKTNENIIIKSQRDNKMSKLFLACGLVLLAISIIYLIWACGSNIKGERTLTGGTRLYSFFEISPVVAVFATIILLGSTVCSLLMYAAIKNSEIVVEKDSVYGYALFGKRVDLPMDSISAVGTSMLKGIAVSTSSGVIKFYAIENAYEIRSIISDLLKNRQQKPKETSAITTITQQIPQSNADELKKYKELLDSGVISQEEFDAKKKQLLGL